MVNNSVIKKWIKAIFQAILGVVGFITYLRLREWFIPIVNNIWLVGWFEGIATLGIINKFVDEYGNTISEILLGLQELGHQRRVRGKLKEKTENKDDDPDQ